MYRPHWTYQLGVLGLIFASGCAQSSMPGAPAPAHGTARGQGIFAGKLDSLATAEVKPETTQTPPALDATAESSYTQDPVAPVDRKIIYTAYLSIEVERFDALPQEVNRLVQQFDGYIAHTDVQQMQGSRRGGRWTIRVPVNRYREFLGSASGLGVPESLREEASDVSERFVDLEARVASSKQLETQIMELLKKQTDKIDQLLTIERELARVRLEIEQMEGQLRLLSYQVAMSTVHLNAIEKVTFMPAERPALARRASLEWSEAVGRFGRFLEDVAIRLIANTFVILAWIVFGLIAWIVFRAVRRRYLAQA